MDTFAALIPDAGPVPVAAAPTRLAPQFNGALSKGTQVLALAMDYSEVDVVLKLAQVSRPLRALATHENFWSQYLDKLGVDVSNRSNPDILDTTTAFNVLDAGYYESAYSTVLRIMRLLGIYYENSELITKDFANPADQARIIVLAKKLSCLDEWSPADQQRKLENLYNTGETLKQNALDEFQAKVDAGNRAGLTPLVELLVMLHAGDKLVKFYLSKLELPEPVSLLEIDGVSLPALERLQTRATEVTNYLNSKAKEIDEIFGSRLPVYQGVLEKVFEENIMMLVNSLCQEEKETGPEEYFAFVPQCYHVLNKQIDRLEPCQNVGGDVQNKARKLLQTYMEVEIETFLDQQSESFLELANGKVSQWATKIAEQEHIYEQITLQNVPGSQEKSNFLRSFKKVLMIGGDADTKQENSITEFETQAKVMDSKLKGIETLFSLELTLSIIAVARTAIRRAREFANLPGPLGQSAKKRAEELFVDLVGIIGDKHIYLGFQSALNTLNQYDPKKYGRLVASGEGGEDIMTVEPLAIFAELVNIGDLIQQTIHVFFEQELAAPKIVDRHDFVAPSVNTKRRFEQMLDKWVADGLSRGIDVLIEQIDFVLMTVQLASDYNPLPGSPPEVGATGAAKQVISLVKSHVYLLVGSTEKSVLDVFQQEVGLRLYHSLCKHIKRQTISQEGAIRLISDMNYYYEFILTLRQRQLYPYYEALKQISQLFLIDSADGRQIGVAISDMSRFKCVLSSDELVEFVRRRRDWPVVKPKVERVLYGFGECIIS